MDLTTARVFLCSVFLGFCLVPATAKACDTACLIENLRQSAGQIENQRWREQSYRDLARAMTENGQAHDALPLIEKVENPDTRAMTIRAISMNLPENDPEIFKALIAQAENMTHKASQGIALTYIAMGQARVGDDPGAKATAMMLENQALRDKALMENAEIQARRQDYAQAFASMKDVESPAFLNKGFHAISRIAADHGDSEQALQATQSLNDPYLKAQSYFYILDKKKGADN